MKLKVPFLHLFLPRLAPRPVPRRTAAVRPASAAPAEISVRDPGYAARVVRIEPLTAQAVSIEIALEEGYRLNFRAGQCVCVSFLIGRCWFRRQLSISSSPEENRITFAIKRILMGRVSSFTVDRLKVGDEVILDDPRGEFVLPAEAAYEQRYVMLAAGSGIVPVFSLIKDLLDKNPLADVTLVYSNRHPEETLFRREIEALERRHESFRVHWHYTRKDGQGMDPSRRLDGDKILAMVADATRARYYISAPAGLAKSFLDSLKVLGVPESRIHVELYSTPVHVAEQAELQPRRIDLVSSGFLGSTRHLQQERVEPLLETADAYGINVPNHCRVGDCKDCKVKVLQGSVVMEEPNCLSLEDAINGYALACVAYPCEDLVIQAP